MTQNNSEDRYPALRRLKEVQPDILSALRYGKSIEKMYSAIDLVTIHDEFTAFLQSQQQDRELIKELIAGLEKGCVGIVRICADVDDHIAGKLPSAEIKKRAAYLGLDFDKVIQKANQRLKEQE